MAKGKLYEVFTESDGWGMFRNKKKAFAQARKFKGKVKSITLVGSESVYDRPTFNMISTLEADFSRPAKKKAIRRHKRL